MSFESRLVQRIDWQPVHGAMIYLDDRGFLVLGDRPRADYHLLRWTDRKANGTRARLRIVAKPAATCNTNIYVHHWGYRDVCSIAKDGTVVLNEGVEELQVARREDSFLEIDVTFRNFHDTLSLGTGKPGGHYEGSGTDQFIFELIDVRI